MSGHNKWSTIKHKKARVDQRRAKQWTKLVREIIVAAREGGGDPEFNASLRLAVDRAKAVNMPKDNIKRAIKKGTGELAGGEIEEILYEGYGAEGVAVIVEAMTDNRNRTAAEVRNLFSKNNGSLGEPGSVVWQFDKKGLVTVKEEAVDEDTLMMDALEAGAEDVRRKPSKGIYAITCDPTSLAQVSEGMEKAGYKLERSEFTWLPQTTMDLDRKVAEQIARLWGALEENDDVQNVFLNGEIPDDLVEEYVGE